MFQVRLKELREKAGLSQNALAKQLGFAQSTVGMWESGKNKPEYDTLTQIADFFNVSTDYLTGREKEKTPTVQDGRSVSDDDIMFALWGDAKDVDKDDLDDVKRYAAFVRERKNKK